MTPNFRVLTSNFCFTSDSVRDKTFTIRWGRSTFREKEGLGGGRLFCALDDLLGGGGSEIDDTWSRGVGGGGDIF